MRKRIWITCIVVIAACLVLLLLKTRQQQKTAALPEQGETFTNQPSQPEQPKAVEKPQSPSIPKPPPALAAEMAYRSTPEGSNAFKQSVLADWQTPIEFYGKVVDENTNPIAGAKVGFHWVEIPAKEGNRTSTMESDAEGLFSLRGAYGPSLMVSVSKEGYYTSRSTPDGFHYGLANEIFHPDPQNPVVFKLQKKGQGAELITSEHGMQLKVDVRVPKDNTPVRVDFFQKQASATGQLEISQNKPPWQGATTWSFSLSIPDGGLLENQDEFQFAAPDTGYQPTVEYHFTKGETGWTTQVTKQFYITFGQPRKYGWLRIESNLAQETIFLTYAINPTGSQNLEPNQ